MDVQIRTAADLRGMSTSEMQTARADLYARAEAIHQNPDGSLRDKTAQEQAEFRAAMTALDLLDSHLQWDARMRDTMRRHPRSVQHAGSGQDRAEDRGGWATAPGMDPRLAEYRSAAMRVIEDYQGASVLSAAAADRADRVLRAGDPQALTARYLAAAGSADYVSAFGKMIADPQFAHLRMTPEETRAVQDASDALAAAEYRAGPVVTSSAGFPLPVSIDPSITLTGTGSLNPVRDLATVTVIGAHDWQGVTSDQVSASYDQEGAEVSDDTPALAGPKISTQMGRAFVPFSVEAGQDWPSIQAELAALIADGRDVLDSTMFLSGVAASYQPIGILAGDATYSLAVAQRVLTAGTAVLAVADPWSLKAALPARFAARATFVANPAIFDTIYRFVGGNSAEPYQFAGGDRSGPFLGRPFREWSAMVSTTTSGSKVLIGGDWAAGFRIVDRLGMQAELIPALVGANHRPTGQRGLFCYWRTGSAVTAQNAFRYLECK